jgi:PAS domain S-box-containing protein
LATQDILASIVLPASTLLQFLAACMAIKLIQMTGWKVAWISIAVAMLLMSFQRGLTFYDVYFDNHPVPTDITFELIALTVAIFMGVGVALIAPLVTSRNLAEDALRQSEQQFRNLIEGSIQGVLIHRDGRPLFANQTFADLFGYESAEEVVARSSVRLFEAEQERARLGEYDGRRMKGEAVPSRHEYAGLRRDGSAIWLENFATLVAWKGEPAIQSTVIDITDQRRFEGALHAARREAEFANHAKSEFLANMSHELRTPLNAIIGFSQMIADGICGPQADPKHAEYADDIKSSGEHLLELINDILDLSKIEAGKVTLNEDDVDVGGIIRSSMTLLSKRDDSGGLTLEYDLPSDLPMLRADGRMVKQILLNLLSNAIKFTPPKGTITVNAWIDPKEGYMLSVTDTGLGIAPGDIPNVMEPFGQIDGVVNRSHSGTGLGLPLTKSLVELHGGSFELQSTVDVGTTVTVRFPASRIVTLRPDKDVLGRRKKRSAG